MSTNLNGQFVCDVAQPIPSGATYTPGATNGGGSVDFPALSAVKTLSFTSGAGAATLVITDAASDGDVYEAILDGVSIGWTSAAVLYVGPTSTRTWSLTLTAGTHTLELWDIVLSYDGQTSPFGGGPVDAAAGQSPAAVYYDLTFPTPGASMALLDITEYSQMAYDAAGRLLPAGKEPGAYQQVSIGGSSAQSAAFGGQCTFIRVHTDAACRIAIGSNPTAAATTPRMAAGATEFFGVKAGDKLAVITTS